MIFKNSCFFSPLGEQKKVGCTPWENAPAETGAFLFGLLEFRILTI